MIPDFNAVFERVPGKPGQMERHMVRTTIPSVAVGFPQIYLQVEYMLNSKTHLPNPATKDKDVKILCSPYGGWNLTDEFNAPHRSVNLEIQDTARNY